MNEVQRHNDHQIEYYSHRALPRLEPTPGRVTPYVDNHVRTVLSAAGVGPGDRVLDVGCGPGKYTIAMAERGVDVEGLDLTPRLVEELRGASPGMRAHVGDLMDPPAELRGQFDVVTGYFVLHHIADLRTALAGTAALLRPHGHAVFCEPNPLFAGYYAQVTLTPGMTWRGERGILRMWPRAIARAAREVGFLELDVHRFGLLPPVLANRARWNELEARLERIPGWSHARAFQVFTLTGS